MKADLFESKISARTLACVVFIGGYLFGLYLVYVLFYSIEWDKYPILIAWMISNFMFPGLGMLLGNMPLWLPFLPILYGVYAVIAYKRLQRIGLRLFVAHYVLAILVLGMLLFYAKAEISDVTHAVVAMFKNPTLLLLCIPFALGNLWYLRRLCQKQAERP